MTYAEGTQGLAQSCAPSLQMAAGTEYDGGAIIESLKKGYAVTVTDYQGYTSGAIPTYIAGRAEGQAVLDAVRAGRQVPGSGIGAGAPVVVWGYSQGGQAAGWAGELQSGYAPDVKIVGVAAGGVPADLQAVSAFGSGSVAAAFSLNSLIGLNAAYPEEFNAVRGGSGLDPQEHPQDRLGTLGFRLFAGDEIEVGVGLDQPHDHIGQLVQADGEIEPRTAVLFFKERLNGIDQPLLEVGPATGEQPHRVLAIFGQPVLHAGVGDDRVEETLDDRDDALGALLADFRFDEFERAQRERPHDLDYEVIARAEPAVERHAVDAQLVGNHAHVDAFGRQKPASPETQRIGGPGP